MNREEKFVGFFLFFFFGLDISWTNGRDFPFSAIFISVSVCISSWYCLVIDTRVWIEKPSNIVTEVKLIRDRNNLCCCVVEGKFDSKNLTSVSKFQVNPQFYAFRWITLLLTQEFDFADSLRIWDTLVSDPDGPQVQIYSFLPCIVLGLRLSEKYLIISWLYLKSNFEWLRWS
jgi:hypothetical protein